MKYSFFGEYNIEAEKKTPLSEKYGLLCLKDSELRYAIEGND